MKQLLLTTVALIATCVAASAAIYSQTLNAGLNSAITNGATIYRLTLINNVTSNSVVRLIDSSSTNLTWTNAAYVSRALTSSNVVTTYADFFGNSITNTNTVLVSTLTTNTASTNNYPTLGLWSVTTNNPLISVEFTYPLVVTRGLLITNGGTIDVTVEYAR